MRPSETGRGQDPVSLLERRPGAEPREDLAGRGEGRCRLRRSAERHQAAPLAEQGVPLFVGHAEVAPPGGGGGEVRSPPTRTPRASPPAVPGCSPSRAAPAGVAMPAAESRCAARCRAASPSSPHDSAVLTASGTTSTTEAAARGAAKQSASRVERRLAPRLPAGARPTRRGARSPCPSDLALAALVHHPGMNGVGSDRLSATGRSTSAWSDRRTSRSHTSSVASTSGSRSATCLSASSHSPVLIETVHQRHAARVDVNVDPVASNELVRFEQSGALARAHRARRRRSWS